MAVLADLQGPKIRLGTFASGPVTWATGSTVCITVEDVKGTAERVSTTYKDLANDVQLGDRLLVDDGKIKVVAVLGRERASFLQQWPTMADSNLNVEAGLNLGSLRSASKNSGSVPE